MGNVLPRDLLVEIVAWLPPEDILRIRQVCRSSRDLVRDPVLLNLLPGRKSSRMLIAAKQNEIFLLRDHSSSWTTSPRFPRCPIDPSAAFVGASDGLVCYGSGDGKTCELNYVVSNPVTGDYLQLPTLHAGKQFREISTQRVTMVVRNGRLHQLWVELLYSTTFVYDCFITKAAMEQRIANSGKLIVPLPNLWMEFYFLLSPLRRIVYMEPLIIVQQADDDIVVNVDDFSVVESIHQPVGWTPDDRFFYIKEMNMFVCDGKLLFQVMSHAVQKLVTFSIGSFFDDMCLLSCSDGECFYFRNFCATSGSGGLQTKWVEEDAIRVSKPPGAADFDLYDWSRLELSFSDSPGSLASPDDFNWSMVSFPEGNHEKEELLHYFARWNSETQRIERTEE